MHTETIDAQKTPPNNMAYYGVIGFPIKHSLSPYIHQQFAKQMGEKLHYVAIEVKPEEFLNQAHEFLKQGSGLNVTAPFKRLALKLAQKINPAAKKAEATNTLIKNKEGLIIADNTDGIGLVRDLKLNHHFNLNNKQILILGAGGAARGILSALMNENPAKIFITNRSFDKTKNLAEHFKVNALTLSELTQHSFDLILHASTHLPELPTQFSAQSAFCYDLNYGERSIPFKQWALTQGCVYSDGLGMLVEQAAEAFYLWRRIRPETADVIAACR